MRLDNETLKLLNFFEHLTRAKVKDCFFYNGRIVFIVYKGEMSKAIGKQGANVKKLENMSKKKVKIVEFNDDVCIFVKNYLMPVKVENVEVEGEEVSIKVSGVRDKGLIIGRDAKNLVHLKDVVKKYFKVNDIKVV
jgi:NusA-like KH domain protein